MTLLVGSVCLRSSPMVRTGPGVLEGAGIVEITRPGKSWNSTTDDLEF